MNEFAIYAGIVVMNSDPDKRGRVKVFVPGINSTQYENWNAVADNKEFSFIDGDLISILEPLREDLPWADCATGIFSGNSTYLDNNLTPRDLVRPSDTLVTTPPTDEFQSENYTPGDYSETSGGTYAIPNVGSHVYVFFKDGSTDYPVYFASAHSKEEWQAIFKDHYPTGYENNRGGEYQNKQVLNSNKHTIEFIDTDNYEEVKWSHFSGSNIAMLNEYNSRYAVNDDYILVESDKYLTVGNDKHTIIKHDENEEIRNNTNTLIKANQTIEVLQNLFETIGINITQDVGGDYTLTIGGNLTINVDGNTTINSGGTCTNTSTKTNTVIGSTVQLNP